MLVLALFAFLSGAATAVTPCVLPVLPALLSASASGGRRRVVGVIGGVFATFTIAIVGLASVVDSAGVASEGVRKIATVVLLAFGLTLLFPAVAARVEAPLTRLAKFGPRHGGDGFWSGLLVGAALGFVFAPCASPILGAVIATGATQGLSVRLLVVAVAFALGTATVLFALAFGGRRIADGIRRAGRGVVLQRALGVIMIATAVAMFTDADLKAEAAFANHLPSWLVTPTHGIENSHGVQQRLADLRGAGPKFTKDGVRAGAHHMVRGGLPVLGTAPDFTGTQRWFNTPGGKPLSLKQLRGKVVLVDFWTYTCINCIRTLPYLKAWDAKYRDKGLVIVGVHTPEFSFEHDAGNVESAIKRDGIHYPVAQDNNYATWNAWGNQYWPAHYLIDADGKVRDYHFGEGAYKKTEGNIRKLLAERGDMDLGAETRTKGQVVTNEATPETYLGTARAQGWYPRAARNGVKDYTRLASPPPANAFAFQGVWKVTSEDATAGPHARILANVTGKRVFLVMSSASDKPRKVRVYVNGKLHRTVTVSGQRLYQLVGLARPSTFDLDLEFDQGISGYAFTFG